MKKIKYGGRVWRRRVQYLAYNHLIISQCQKCGSPVHKGYFCEFCGDDNPSQTVEQEEREKAYYKATQFIQSISGVGSCVVCGRQTNTAIWGHPDKPVCIDHFDKLEDSNEEQRN